MKVLVSNLTGFTIYLDQDGNAQTEDTVIVGPKARRKAINLPSEARYLALAKEYKGTLTFRKA